MTVIDLADGTTLNVADYPLPDGVDDAALNRGQLAKAMQVSENTISAWVDDGMPFLSQGGNGRSYEFQLSHCYAWRMRRDSNEAARRAAGDAAAQQMSQTFMNLGEDQGDQQSLSAKEIKALSDAEYQRMRVAEMRGELVRSDHVRKAMEDMIVEFCSALNVLPDWAEQEFGLSPEQVSRMVVRCDAAIEETALSIQRHLLATAKVTEMAQGAAQQSGRA